MFGFFTSELKINALFCVCINSYSLLLCLCQLVYTHLVLPFSLYSQQAILQHIYPTSDIIRFHILNSVFVAVFAHCENKV